MFFLWIVCFIVFVCMSRTVGAVVSYFKPLFYAFLVLWAIYALCTVVAANAHFLMIALGVIIVLFVINCSSTPDA